MSPGSVDRQPLLPLSLLLLLSAGEKRVVQGRPDGDPLGGIRQEAPVEKIGEEHHLGPGVLRALGPEKLSGERRGLVAGQVVEGNLPVDGLSQNLVDGFFLEDETALNLREMRRQRMPPGLQQVVLDEPGREGSL